MARPPRRAADRPQSLRRRSPRGAKPHRGRARQAARRGVADAPSPGPRRLSAKRHARPLGLGDHAHRRRGIRNGAAPDRRGAGVGHDLDARVGLRHHPAGGARPAAHRRDAAHLRLVPRRVSNLAGVVRAGGRGAGRARRTRRGKSIPKRRLPRPARVRSRARRLRRWRHRGRHRSHAGNCRRRGRSVALGQRLCIWRNA